MSSWTAPRAARRAFSGADLANLLNKAAINAVRDGRTTIAAGDVDAARDRVILGHRDGANALLPEERHSVAMHESGDALLAALCEHADPVAKVTILPTGLALGATEQLPEVERHLYSQDYLTDLFTVRLGGRAAELVVPGRAPPARPATWPTRPRSPPGGLILAGHISDWVGRKRILMPAIGLELIAAVLFLTNTSLPVLLVARVITGLGVGMVTATTTAPPARTAHRAQVDGHGRRRAGPAPPPLCSSRLCKRAAGLRVRHDCSPLSNA